MDVTDREDQGAEVPVSRKEALEAANTLRSFVSDRTNEWAHSLETALMAMARETQYEGLQNMKGTVITSYFAPKTQ